MSFNTNTPKPPEKPAANRAAEAISYLRQGFFAGAYLILSQPGLENQPAAQFALGLCHLHAGEPDAAIPELAAEVRQDSDRSTPDSQNPDRRSAASPPGISSPAGNIPATASQDGLKN